MGIKTGCSSRLSGRQTTAVHNFVRIGVWGSGSPRTWGVCSGGSIPPTPTKLKLLGESIQRKKSPKTILKMKPSVF